MGRKPKNEQGNTRERILDAAQELFARKGFHATGVHDIAKRANITYSVIYYHFKNKNQILETLFNQFLQCGIEGDKQVYDQILNDNGEKNVGETIDAWIKTNRAHIQKWKRMCRIVFMEAVKKDGRPELLYKLFEESMKAFKERYGDKIKSDIEDPAGKAFFKYFFWCVIPGLAVYAFEDSWAERYGIDSTRIRELYAECSDDLFDPLLGTCVLNR